MNRFKEKQLPEGVPALTTYYMYLTGGCNLACRHCWIAPTFQVNGDTGGHLDYGLYQRAIEEALPLGLKSIKFTGGEPLLHPDFVRMADYATEKGLMTWMETNGTLMTPRLAHHLKERTSLGVVSVSLDGASASTHDDLRNVPGSFDRARQGLFDLIEAGYRPQVIMSLYPGNLNEVEMLVRWAEEVGCGSVKFNLIQPSGRGEQMKQRGEWPEIEEWIQLGRWIERDLQKRISIPLLYSWPMAFYGISRLLDNRSGICNIEHILGVLASGNLAMCGIGTQEKDLVYGQLGLDRVRDIWIDHPTLLRMRAIILAPREGICQSCLHQKLCKGYCLAQNYYAGKRLTAPFWFCQMAEQSHLFPLTRKI